MQWTDKCDQDDIVVFVDPLDGTKEFTEGITSAVTVLIGISWKGTPLCGVVHQPWCTDTTQKCYWGCLDVGTFSNECEDGKLDSETVWTKIEQPPTVDGRIAIATTRSHSRPEVNTAIEASKATEIIRIGGAGNKVIKLLEGEVDCYLFPVTGTSRWDTCAGEVLLAATGGALTDKAGGHYEYPFSYENTKNSRGVIAVAHRSKLEYFVQACAEAPPSL
eukprot:m.432058 g.432058  ORF g.432058 m.432058 type:complete len:219 (-) comp21407_c0_seq28:1862-2518(-)